MADTLDLSNKILGFGDGSVPDYQCIPRLPALRREERWIACNQHRKKGINRIMLSFACGEE